MHWISSSYGNFSPIPSPAESVTKRRLKSLSPTIVPCVARTVTTAEIRMFPGGGGGRLV